MRVAKNNVHSVKDISGRIASSYGTAIHNALEASWKSPRLPDTLSALGYPSGMVKQVIVNPTDEEAEHCIPIYTEYLREYVVGNWTVSGEFDFVAEGRVRDLKTTGTYTFINKTNDDKYVKQGSMYRWLNPERITDDIMAIDYVFTDWSALQATIQKDKYPQMRMMEQLFTLNSIEDTESFIYNKLALLDELRYAEQSDMPACTNEELWIQPSKFKYYKKPDAKRATRVYDTHSEAMTHYMKDGGIGIVHEHKGEVRACKWCDGLPTCEQAQKYINSGELKL